PGSATLGALTPADEPQNPTNPAMPGTTLGGQGSGLTGEARTVFINKTIDERNSVLDSSTRLLSLRKRDGRYPLHRRIEGVDVARLGAKGLEEEGNALGVPPPLHGVPP